MNAYRTQISVMEMPLAPTMQVLMTAHVTQDMWVVGSQDLVKTMMNVVTLIKTTAMKRPTVSTLRDHTSVNAR